jgi:sulfur carrier protein
MKITINGSPLELPEQSNFVSVALALYQSSHSVPSMFALALNGNFVGQANYSTTPINEGDNIDIFAPIQGG